MTYEILQLIDLKYREGYATIPHQYGGTISEPIDSTRRNYDVFILNNTIFSGEITKWRWTNEPTLLATVYSGNFIIDFPSAYISISDRAELELGEFNAEYWEAGPTTTTHVAKTLSTNNYSSGGYPPYFTDGSAYNLYIGIDYDSQEYYRLIYNATESRLESLYYYAPFYPDANCVNGNLIKYGRLIVQYNTSEVVTDTQYFVSLSTQDTQGNTVDLNMVNSSVGQYGYIANDTPLNGGLGRNLSPVYGVVAGTPENPSEIFLGRFGSILLGAVSTPNYILGATDSGYMIFPSNLSTHFNVALPVGNVTLEVPPEAPPPPPPPPPELPPEFNPDGTPNPEAIDFQALFIERINQCSIAAFAEWNHIIEQGLVPNLGNSVEETGAVDVKSMVIGRLIQNCLNEF